MTSTRLDQQLTLDFLTTPAPATRTQEPMASSALLGQISQPGIALWSAPIEIPGEAEASAMQTKEPLEPEPPRNQHNYRITEADHLGSGSLKSKCQHNLAALELLKRIEAEDRRPTPSERRTLVRYVGWGGLPQVFDSRNEQWSQERQRLEQLLTPEELESARATTLNAHYTAPVRDQRHV